MKNKEELILSIKECGQSLIDNADKIAGNYEYMTNLTITCYPFYETQPPFISIDSEFIPEKFIERIENIHERYSKT